MNENILINKSFLPHNYSTITMNKLRRMGYKGIKQSHIFYTANTGGGLNKKPILQVLTSMVVKNYQLKFMKNGKRISDK